VSCFALLQERAQGGQYLLAYFLGYLIALAAFVARNYVRAFEACLLYGFWARLSLALTPESFASLSVVDILLIMRACLNPLPRRAVFAICNFTADGLMKEGSEGQLDR